jgi:hypothetical protein
MNILDVMHGTPPAAAVIRRPAPAPAPPPVETLAAREAR